mmetsp:Transcript_33196/g.49996  ORF Transcript_33196/g.49996 Transcript_33196/m.49996 type:complete len:357 (-) Transcript_33196:218-1288(-)
MAGKRGDKRKQPTKTTASEGKRSSPRKSPRKFKADDISDLSDDEHLQNEAVIDRNKKQKKSTKRILSSKNAPSIQNDHVEFSLSNLTSHLTCELCGGYYRDCHTIVDCLHSFCRSCLTLFFEKKGLVGKNKNVTPRLSCPTCDIEVGPHPFRRHTSISTVQIIPDRTLQEVVDKMFPRFKVQEVEDEKKFYAERNIKLKAEYQMLENNIASDRNVQESMKSPLAGGVTMAASSTAMVTAAAAFMSDNIIELRLQPDIKSSKSTKRLPALHNHQLRTSGKLKIISLKKYILQRLESGGKQKDSKADSNNKTGLHSLEILCNGHPMGNELNLTFIYRTMWLFTTPDEILTLTYRQESE